MIISVYNLKGGTGKTSIALNLAKTRNSYFIENDIIGVSDVFNKHGQLDTARNFSETKKIPIIDNVVYDFGGHLDKRITSVLVKSDLVIVPTLHSYQDIKSTISMIESLLNIKQKNILVVINKVGTRAVKTSSDGNPLFSEYEKTKNIILDHLEERVGKRKHKIMFMMLRESKAWHHSTYRGDSILHMAEEDSRLRYSFRNSITDLNRLLKVVKHYEEKNVGKG